MDDENKTTRVVHYETHGELSKKIIEAHTISKNLLEVFYENS